MRPCFSLFMVREMIAVCVEWKPERMPQATVMKKMGMKWWAVKYSTIAEGRLLTVAASTAGDGVERDAMPVIPQVQQGIALDEQADEHTHGGEQQDGAEDGIDAADDGVDGEHGGNQIVDEDNTVDDPGGGIMVTAPEKPKTWVAAMSPGV